MTSTERRRLGLAVYSAAMVLLSVWILGVLFTPGEVTRIYDREEVLRLRAPAVLTEVTVGDGNWPETAVTDPELLFRMDQWLAAIPPAEGQFPGEAPGRLSGVFTFEDGRQRDYVVGTALVMDGGAYYSREAEEALRELRRCLAGQLYTLEHLAAFFEGEYRICLTGASGGRFLSAEEAALLGAAVARGELAGDPEEVEQTVGGRAPRYTVSVRDAAGIQRISLWIYADEAIQVYGACGAGRQQLMCFSGRLLPLCRRLLPQEGT